MIQIFIFNKKEAFLPQSASPVPANPYLPPCPGINLAPDGDPVVESDELMPINPERTSPLLILDLLFIFASQILKNSLKVFI